jgi:putative transposase
MQLQPDQLYHIYNRGNNQQLVFFQEGNYLFFVRKLREFLLPHAHLLAWCLMPNHFHLLVQLRDGASPQRFSDAIGTLLSSYTRAVNRQQNRTGSLFQQKTKAKLLDSGLYALNCFCYIHQNPRRAALEHIAGAWPWSSFQDYVGRRQGTLCNAALATQLLDLPADYAERLALLLQVVPDDVRSGMY